MTIENTMTVAKGRAEIELLIDESGGGRNGMRITLLSADSYVALAMWDKACHELNRGDLMIGIAKDATTIIIAGPHK